MLAFRGVRDPVGVDESHRMRPDRLGDDELHPGEPNPVDREPGVLESHVGVADVDQDLGLGIGEGAEIDGRDLDGDLAGEHPAQFPFRARHGDVVTGDEALGGVGCPHHRGDAELAGDDRGVAGTTSPVGDDGSRGLHHRLPVGGGGVGDQDLAGPERRQSGGVLHHTDRPRGRRRPHRPALDQYLCPLLHVVVDPTRLRSLGHDGLGPRLDQVQQSIETVFRPLDVHGSGDPGMLAVVTLDLDGVAGQGQGLFVRDAEPFPVRIRCRDVGGGLAPSSL